MEPLRADDPRSLGGYRVLARLAVGGMGRVYLALDADRKAVALKVARPEFAADARFRVRFRREVATARGVGGGGAGGGRPAVGAGDRRDDADGGLVHAGGWFGGASVDGGPRSGASAAERRGGASAAERRGGPSWIAPVVAADPEAELPWLASEYVPGPSVTEAVMGFGPLSAAGLRTLTCGLASALAEVHAAGVVHRDVKPSNVLLARDGPRLIDFGVARALDDVQLTRHGAVIGSPGFLSPEQAEGKPATFGSDVFALASVIVYAACGVGPFGAGEGPALLYRVVHEPPAVAGVPADLAEVLAACLAKDHAQRPTAAEIADRVDAEGDWLAESVLRDIARREAELAAWIEVAGTPDPLWVRAVAAVNARADFDATGHTALEVAKAEVGSPSPATEPAAEPAAETAREPAIGDAPRPATESLALPATTASTACEPAVEPPPPRLPRPHATHTHRRTARRATRRFPVYAVLGAIVGAAATATVLLFPHSGSAAPPPPSTGPVLTPLSSASVPSTPKTAPPASSGRRSGPRQQRSATPTSASKSPR